MAYSKITWTNDGGQALDAANLNRMEDGIDGASPAGHTHVAQGITVQDEGGALATAATALNFVGAGVVASGTGATKTITVAGGSGGPTNVTAGAQNLKAWNFDPAISGTNTGTSIASGSLYLSRVQVPTAVTLSNVSIVIGATATTTATSAYAHVFGPDGALIRGTAESSATLNTKLANEIMTFTLTSPVVVGGGGEYDYVYLGFAIQATTVPTVFGITGTIAQLPAINFGLTASQRRHLTFTAWDGVTPLVLANGTQAATPKHFWMAAT